LQKIKENLAVLKSTKIITQGGITIAKHNIQDLEKIAEYAINELKFDEIYFSLPIKLNNSTYKLGNDEFDAIDLSNLELIKAIDQIILLKQKYGDKITHRIKFLKDIKRFYAQEKQVYPCKAGENIFFLDNHLNLFDCMVKNSPLGKITDSNSIKVLNGINCFDCPLQCFREGSIYLRGLKSLPFFIEQMFNKNYWKLIKR
jgi:sulfatase maturation enzyme AslB (radical SAM superfamily)